MGTWIHLIAFSFLFTALAYLILGIWVIARHKSYIQRLYGIFSITTSFWQGIWVILFLWPDAPWLFTAL